MSRWTNGADRSRSPRVLVLARSYPNDVLPTLGLWIARPTELLAQCCDITVVSPIPYCPPLPDVGRLRQYTRFRRISEEERRAGVHVLRPRFLSAPGTSLYAFEAEACYAATRPGTDRLHEQLPFDLIHAHFIYPEGAVAHRLSRRYGIPFVVTEHAPWSDQWFRRRAVRRRALEAAAAASRLLAVSSSVRDTIVAWTGESDRLDVVPVGVDETLFAPGPADDRRPGQILYAGQINFNKGIDVLFEAFARLEAQGDAVRLVLVGGSFYRNTRLQEEKLRALASSLGLEDRVAFLGIRTPAEVADLMRESGVLVLPSRAESFGAVLVEALACGTPVVATRCGGPEDIVTDDVGVLVPPDDPGALAAAMGSVLRNGDAYRPEKLREHAVSRFSVGAVAQRIYAEYAAVLAVQGLAATPLEACLIDTSVSA